jgi:phosphonate metabolism protein PhnN/1,5-bisphosphokinase (PRPP-forming)
MARAGCFVLVVGPSGAGKDTLLAGAAERLSGDARFFFPHRLITRQALPEAEAHGTISRAEFDRMVKTGDFALAWEAHGLGYVIPKAVAEAVATGRFAVCNASRKAVPGAIARFPGTHVIHVDAIQIIRATRLAARGRETAEEIEQRLAREVPRLPASVPVTVVDNSGALEDGVAALVTALLALAGSQTPERERA